MNILNHQLKINDKAPDFKLLNTENALVSLKDFPQTYKILSIFPAIHTKVCDLQTTTFYKTISNTKEIVVLNISKDSPQVQKEWCLAKHFNNIVTLSAINDCKFASNYGVKIWIKKFLKRAVFVLDKDNKIIYVEYVKVITNPIDFAKINEFLKSIKK